MTPASGGLLVLVTVDVLLLVLLAAEVPLASEVLLASELPLLLVESLPSVLCVVVTHGGGL